MLRYGEFKIGAGRGSRDLFYITIGEGIAGRSFSTANSGPVLPVRRGSGTHHDRYRKARSVSVATQAAWKQAPRLHNIVRRANERLIEIQLQSLSKLAMNKNFTADDHGARGKEGDDFSLDDD